MVHIKNYKRSLLKCKLEWNWQYSLRRRIHNGVCSSSQITQAVISDTTAGRLLSVMYYFHIRIIYVHNTRKHFFFSWIYQLFIKTFNFWSLKHLNILKNCHINILRIIKYIYNCLIKCKKYNEIWMYKCFLLYIIYLNNEY